MVVTVMVLSELGKGGSGWVDGGGDGADIGRR